MENNKKHFTTLLDLYQDGKLPDMYTPSMKLFKSIGMNEEEAMYETFLLFLMAFNPDKSTRQMALEDAIKRVEEKVNKSR